MDKNPMTEEEFNEFLKTPVDENGVKSNPVAEKCPHVDENGVKKHA